MQDAYEAESELYMHGLRQDSFKMSSSSSQVRTLHDLMGGIDEAHSDSERDSITGIAPYHIKDNIGNDAQGSRSSYGDNYVGGVEDKEEMKFMIAKLCTALENASMVSHSKLAQANELVFLLKQELAIAQAEAADLQMQWQSRNEVRKDNFLIGGSSPSNGRRNLATSNHLESLGLLFGESQTQKHPEAKPNQEEDISSQRISGSSKVKFENTLAFKKLSQMQQVKYLASANRKGDRHHYHHHRHHGADGSSSSSGSATGSECTDSGSDQDVSAAEGGCATDGSVVCVGRCGLPGGCVTIVAATTRPGPSRTRKGKNNNGGNADALQSHVLELEDLVQKQRQRIETLEKEALKKIAVEAATPTKDCARCARLEEDLINSKMYASTLETALAELQFL
jgi:hypothetical protein